MTRINKGLIFIIVCIAVLTGCSESNDGPVLERTRSHLRIGLIPERNLFKQLERYEPVAKYITEKTGATIDLKILTRYGNIIDNFVTLNLDGVFLGSFVYALAEKKLGVEVLARPEMSSGVSTYHGLIFVRKESGINNEKDMEGKVFAFVDRATTAGYIFPLAYFKRNGISNVETYFGDTYFAGTHEDVIKDVLNGKADIGAAKNTVYYLLSRQDRSLTKALNILARSADVPENGFAVRKDLDDTLKTRLKQTLLQMHDVSDGIIVLKNFGAKRFIETTKGDYAGVFALSDEIGLDLKNYNYLND